MKAKHILVVLLFIVIWLFIQNYNSIIHSFQLAEHMPIGEKVNGKKQGKWMTFYLNGQLKVVEYYKNDTLNGPLLAYYPNGNIRRKVNYRMGITVDSDIMYHVNGRINYAGYNDSLGREQGCFKIYYANGNLSQFGKMKDGLLVDTSKIYFKSGHLKTVEFYANGKKSGEWKYYNEIGQIIQVETYKNDSLITSKIMPDVNIK